MAESAGELYVSITGDISALLTALQAGEDAAKAAGEAIAAALDTGTVDKSFQDLGTAAQVMGDQAKQAGTDIQTLATETNTAGAEAETAEIGWKTLSDQLGQILEVLQDLPEKLNEAGEGAKEAGDEAEEAESAFSKLSDTFKEITGLDLAETLTVAGFADLAKEALEAYAGVQKAEIALTALTGSATKAEDAISGLKSLALQDALSFPTLVEADQRMTALGFDLEKIPTVLQAAADAAAATGRGFDTVTNAIDRMVLSGTANARMLASLGISLQDLGAQLGVTADKAAAAFKALDPSDRIDIIVGALNKYQGVAAQVAQGIAGQWQNLQTQWDFILEDMGAKLAPVASALMSVVSEGILPFGKAVIDQFASGATAVTEFVQTMKDVESQFVTQLANMTGAITLFRQAQQFLRDNGGSDFELMIPGVTDLKDAIQGLTLAMQAFSNTGPQIDQMTQSIAQHMTQLGAAATMGGQAFKDAWNLSVAEDQGTISAAIEKVIDAQNKANDAVVTAKGVFDALNQSFVTQTALANGYVATQADVNRALQLLTTAEKSASDAVKVHKDSLDTLIASMAKAQQAFTDAKTILEQTATAYQNGTVGIGALDQAYVKVESSAKAAGQTFSDVTIKAELMTKAAQDQAAALTTAVEVWQKLKDGSIPGSQAAIADALTAVDAAAKKVGISVTQVGDGLKFVTDGATNAKGPVADLANTLNGLAGIQQEGIIVNGKFVASLLQSTDDLEKTKDATKDVTVSMQEAGATITESGNTIGLAIDSVTNKIKVLTPTRDKDTDSTKTHTAAIKDNTAATNDNTNAAIQVNQAWDAAATKAQGTLIPAVTNLNTALRDNHGVTMDAADAAAIANANWDKEAISAKNLAAAIQSIGDAEASTDLIGGTLGKTSGGTGGKGGAGGSMSLMSVFEDAASALSNPLASAQGSFTLNDLNNLATQIGLFVTGNGQYSTTDPSKDPSFTPYGPAVTQLTSASTSISGASTTLSTGSTQLQAASAALTTAASTTAASSTVIQQAASVLTSAAAGLAMIAPAMGINVPAISVPGMPAIPSVSPSVGMIGSLITSNPANAGPVVQLTITGNTISSQAAADQLATTVVNKLRNQAGLKLTGF